jgi:hypothetical protein
MIYIVCVTPRFDLNMTTMLFLNYIFIEDDTVIILLHTLYLPFRAFVNETLTVNPFSWLANFIHYLICMKIFISPNGVCLNVHSKVNIYMNNVPLNKDSSIMVWAVLFVAAYAM